MTVAEEKVNEFANKILNLIEQSEQEQADPKWILQGIKGYLCGMSDGIEFAEEMRGPDHEVQAKTDEPRPSVGDSVRVRLDLCKESIDKIDKTLREAYPSNQSIEAEDSWISGERSEIDDTLDKQLGVPEPTSGVKIRCDVKD